MLLSKQYVYFVKKIKKFVDLQKTLERRGHAPPSSQLKVIV